MSYCFNITCVCRLTCYHCYIINFRMPHKCHGNGENCPSRSHPIWEMPINELDRREDPDFDERLSGCHLVSSCSNVYERAQFRTLLDHNFNRYKSCLFNYEECCCNFSVCYISVCYISFCTLYL